MKVKNYIIEESLSGDVVFVTEPPVNQAIVDAFNAGLNREFEAAKLAVRDGKIVISRAGVTIWRRESGGAKLAPYLESILAFAEKQVEDGIEQASNEKRRKIAELDQILGVKGI